MRQGTASDLAPAAARYATVEDARTGGALLLRNDRVLRVMVVSNRLTASFVEWRDR